MRLARRAGDSLPPPARATVVTAVAGATSTTTRTAAGALDRTAAAVATATATMLPTAAAGGGANWSTPRAAQRQAVGGGRCGEALDDDPSTGATCTRTRTTLIVVLRALDALPLCRGRAHVPVRGSVQ